MVFQEHLAALSPYSHIQRHPSAPISGRIAAAVYLFRHGILEVSQSDFNIYIKPFLHKLDRLQHAGKPFVRGTLTPLSTYQSWITEAHVGMISSGGLKQTSDLGRHFRTRYSPLLQNTKPDGNGILPLMSVWTDSAMRCRLSAIAFAETFSGRIMHGSGRVEDDIPRIDCQVRVLNSEDSLGTCKNLSWHTALCVDQQAGTKEMRQLMKVTTSEVQGRLKGDWVAADTFGAEDVYAMQLLHCYDVVSGRQSAFNNLFTLEDWVAFEYLRDTKYYFSEGYGGDVGQYALPWLTAALGRLSRNEVTEGNFPLHVSFTHREEVLYLCCLLGIGYEEGWAPNLDRVDESRRWRVSLLAPYLGHVGVETYDAAGGKRLRIIVNGNVMPAFWGRFEQDLDGGYDFTEVAAWALEMPRKWEGFEEL